VIKFQAIAKGCGFLSTRYYQESNGEYVFEYTFCLRGVSISPWEIVIYPMLEEAGVKPSPGTDGDT
jgi:hypothetical protein